MPLEVQIGQLMEEIYLTPIESSGLEHAKTYIKNLSASLTGDIDCSMLTGCAEKTRRTLLQLQMIEWGIFGMGSSAPGSFLANHFSDLGPYFGSFDGHDWPNDPLAKAPSLLESGFHEEMVKITAIISNGKVSNISILDFVAFGSMIPWLKKHHKREPNWPIEMNFAIRHKSEDSILEIFKEYKTLIKGWKEYMERVHKRDPLNSFTSEMENKHFNFSKYIRADISTFLIATHGSFLTASDQTEPIWNKIANTLFNSSNISQGLSRRSLYDRLIMQCGFEQDISKQENVNLNSGCHLLDPTLTTNGMCYSFNAGNTSMIWKPSEVTNSFEHLFPSKQSRHVFRRAGKNEGN